MKKQKRKAVILMSGGLDSTIVSYLMSESDIDLSCLHFTSPFCTCNGSCNEKSFAKETAMRLKLPYKVLFMGTDYLKIIENPKYGYGKNMNPCIDCRIFKFKLAKKIMIEQGADFIITGEVLGQRPMSQNMRSMKIIEKESGLEGLILRPLSANMLEQTLPELKGIVDRNKLLSVTGRSRKHQYELARKYNIKEEDYSCPSGGCRLTNYEYSLKLKDLIENSMGLNIRDITLLNKGRHFRISEDFKIIVGRNEAENKILEGVNSADKNIIKMYAADYNGPVCIGLGKHNKQNIDVMSGICGRYVDSPGLEEKIKFRYNLNNEEGFLESFPFKHEKVVTFSISKIMGG